MTDLFRELPFNPDDVHAQAARAIIEKMNEARAAADDPRETAVDLDAKAVEQLLRRTRHAHRMALSDFKRRNDPEWIFPRRRPRGRRLYDYGADTGAGLEDWPAWWKSIWGRRRANPGMFRGTDIAKPPLVAIYHLCNRWWRLEVGTAFRPNFDGIEPGPDAENLPTMNPAARLFLMVAWDCDRRYDSFHCARVHATDYRDLDRRTVP